jgi:hypothetical protein
MVSVRRHRFALFYACPRPIAHAKQLPEEILLLPSTIKGRDPIREKDLRPIATVCHWHSQPRMWTNILNSLEENDN